MGPEDELEEWTPDYEDDEFMDDAVASEYTSGDSDFDNGFDYDLDGVDDAW